MGPDGQLRPAWAQFFQNLGPQPMDVLQSASEAAGRAIIEQDVNMNIYRGELAGTRSWPLDPLPLLISHSEWQPLSQGLRQRARLYNEMLRDIYGPQKLLQDGQLPAGLTMANPHFLRPCVGLGPKQDVFLHSLAVDVVRSADGRWWVLEDRLDAPSGLGYSLLNRIITRGSMPEIFARTPVERLHQFFANYDDSLRRLTGREDPHIVLLSPGAANEIYFEHAYLSNYLGYTLVEGEDLTTRNGEVFLRTVSGLKKVDVVLRRQDSESCDPLELNRASLLGVPGLVNAAHLGNVALANQLGCRVLETAALQAFLQPLCQQVLGEDLQLPNAATWWCGQAGPRDYVLANLEHLVVKPTFRTPDNPPAQYGGTLSRAARAELAEDIKRRPMDWCAHERVFHSTTPGWHEGRLRPMPSITRLYVTWHDGEYVVMPGGLTRCNPRGEDMIVSLQQGGISKDTWVLHDGPALMDTLHLSLRSAESRDGMATPSRTASDFFWLGRYLERTSALARRLEKLEALLSDEVARLDTAVPRDTLRLIYRMLGLPEMADESVEFMARSAHEAAADVTRPSSLAAGAASLVRLLESLKVRLPHEAWQMIRHLRQHRKVGDTAACAWLRQHLTALVGITLETMPRDTGWHFLQLGRRIERSAQLLSLLQTLLPGQPGRPATEFRLQTLLHLDGALFTYRHAYQGSVNPATLLDWLVNSPENPRSLRYSADQIKLHLDALPEQLAPRAVSALRIESLRAFDEVNLADAAKIAENPAEAATLFAGLHTHLIYLSEELNRIYFSHAANR
jgi:uncharacterized circularly permuted ATP-grasp superfamily protein/uncharacterized alpha-E superfamily protein